MSRKKDKVFAKLVLQQRLATVEQINACIGQQRALLAAGKSVRLHEVMVGAGLIDPETAEKLSNVDLEPLSCPRCELRFYYPDFDQSATYTCPQCDGVLVAERERRITGQLRRNPTPPASRGPSESSVMSMLDVNSSSMVMRVPDLDSPMARDGLELRPPEEKDDKLCGSIIGGYRILKKLGQGGMGVIYKAEQLSLNRVVALKMLSQRLARDEQYVDRFIHEARSVARLNNPNIIQIYDVGKEEGRCYFSMEYVRGENVGSILDRTGKIPHRSATSIVQQTAEALREAHANGIVHRDIKPDNIMLSEGYVAKLADLGIAKTDDLHENIQAGSGIQMGTPYYISPEQASNPAAVDIRADIYSLGATFYHMVTGTPPFVGPTPAVILMKLTNDPTPNAHEANSEVPYALGRLIAKMMAKDPDERFEDPRALLAALRELEEPEQAGKSARREKTLMRREVMRIEATEAGGDELKLVEEKKPAPTGRTPRPAALATSAKAKRPRPPMAQQPEPAGNEKTYIMVAIGAVGLVVLLGVVMMLTRGKGGGQDSASSQTSSSVRRSSPSSTQPVDSEEDIAWRKLSAMFPLSEIATNQLPQLAKDLERFAAKYPQSDRLVEVRQRQSEVSIEQRLRRKAALEKALDPLRRARDHRSAEELLTKAIADPLNAELVEGLQSKLRSVRTASKEDAERLERELAEADRRHDVASARRLIEDKGSRLTLAEREKLPARLKAIEAAAAAAARKRAYDEYLPLFERAIDPLRQLDFAGAKAQIEEALQGSVPFGLDKQAELEDFGALIRALETVLGKLEALAGKDVPLRLMRSPKPESTKILSADKGKLVLGTGPLPLTELHPEQLRKFIGDELTPARYQLLWLAMGYEEHAREALAKLPAADQTKARMRFAALHFSRILQLRGLDAIEALAALAVHADQLERGLKGTPEYARVVGEVQAMQRLFGERQKDANALVGLARRKLRSKKTAEAIALCHAVIHRFGDAEATKRARELLAGLR